MQSLRPRWIRDLLRFLPLRSQFVLSGNVRDQYPVEVAPGVVAPFPLVQCLVTELREVGVVHFISFDPAQGFVAPRSQAWIRPAERQFFSKLLGLTWTENGRAAASLERSFELLKRSSAAPASPSHYFSILLPVCW